MLSFKKYYSPEEKRVWLWVSKTHVHLTPSPVPVQFGFLMLVRRILVLTQLCYLWCESRRCFLVFTTDLLLFLTSSGGVVITPHPNVLLFF